MPSAVTTTSLRLVSADWSVTSNVEFSPTSTCLGVKFIELKINIAFGFFTVTSKWPSLSVVPAVFVLFTINDTLAKGGHLLSFTVPDTCLSCANAHVAHRNNAKDNSSCFHVFLI